MDATIKETRVQISKAVDISVEKCYIEGLFEKTQIRTTAAGDEYTVHILQDAKGVGVTKKGNEPEALPKGKYAVFGKTFLNRYMREIGKGDRVKIVYKGTEPNTDEDGEETEGTHHAFDVSVLA